MSTKEAARFGSRVYEYTDDNGVVYWSFTKHPRTISPSQRLTLKSRVGTNLINFLAEMRKKGQALMSGPEEG